MYIAYANEIVRYAADMMGPVDAASSEEMRAMGHELHLLMEKVRAARAERPASLGADARI